MMRASAARAVVVRPCNASNAGWRFSGQTGSVDIEKSTRDFAVSAGGWSTRPCQNRPPDIRYAGTEGELCNLDEDPPLQWRNLWNDAGYCKVKPDLVADLYDNLPKPRAPQLTVDVPA